MILDLPAMTRVDAAGGLGLLVLVALAGGELAQRWLRLPRLCGYVLAGAALGPGGLGWLPAPLASDLRPLLLLGLALLLFELGSRVDLRWLRHNPSLLLLSVVESALGFAAVYVLLRQFGIGAEASYIVAAIGVTSSPSVLIAVAVESRARGQVTQRVLLLSALNTLYSIGLLMLGDVVGGDRELPALEHLRGPLLMVCASFLGACLLALAVGRWIPRLFAAAPAQLLATLALMLVIAMGVRHEAISLPLVFLGGGLLLRHFSPRLQIFPDHFGSVGGMAVLLLFALTGAALAPAHLVQGGLIALALVVVRATAKYLAALAFAGRGGLAPAKAHCLGLALAPMSTLAALHFIEQAGRREALSDPMLGAAVLGGVLLMELVGPPMSFFALQRAGETATTAMEARHGA